MIGDEPAAPAVVGDATVDEAIVGDAAGSEAPVVDVTAGADRVAPHAARTSRASLAMTA